ncbi:hypothetical protein KM029_08365 [Flammeovirga kamogawensis]|uniref:MarR family transcriptional regulator n=1 Tax=Flammeovirga kamogawensis TaxID=373891 RepID=A0ABX8GZV9_9BACT|nr:hypothetical protein [Flammeovirga kamogawensis]QWG08944.1 hypothetical protein KM029_08365 [Flammeovirga kamogawensis]
MSNEVKFSKFLMGMCLNTGESMQAIARNLGININSQELNALVSKFEMEGLVEKVQRTTKETIAYLSPRGNEEARLLIEGVA